MTYCHFPTRRSRENIKICGMTYFGLENSNMAFISEIEDGGGDERWGIIHREERWGIIHREERWGIREERSTEKTSEHPQRGEMGNHPLRGNAYSHTPSSPSSWCINRNSICGWRWTVNFMYLLQKVVHLKIWNLKWGVGEGSLLIGSTLVLAVTKQTT